MQNSNRKKSDMKVWYKDLEKRYADFPQHIQILNVVSDLEKARSFWDRERVCALDHLYRAIILIDFIVDDPRWKGKLKEVLRLREVMGSLIVGSQPLATLENTIRATLLLNRRAYSTLYPSRIQK